MFKKIITIVVISIMTLFICGCSEEVDSYEGIWELVGYYSNDEYQSFEELGLDAQSYTLIIKKNGDVQYEFLSGGERHSYEGNCEVKKNILLINLEKNDKLSLRCKLLDDKLLVAVTTEDGTSFDESMVFNKINE